jgi:hypothetical protein
VLLQTGLDVVELIDLLDDLLLLLLEDALQVLLVLLLLLQDQLLQLPELLLDQLLMDLVGLLYARLVALAYGHVPIDVLHPLARLSLVLPVELDNAGQGVCNIGNVVVLLLLGVLVQALHAHHQTLLLAVKHQRLLMQIALHFLQTLARTTVPTLPTALRVVTGLASPTFLCLRRLPLVVDVAATFSVRHHLEFALAKFARTLVHRLFQLVLTQFGALHVDEEQFFVVAVDQILNVERNGALVADGTADAKLGVQGRQTLRDLDLLSALQTEFVLANELQDGRRLSLAV